MEESIYDLILGTIPNSMTKEKPPRNLSEVNRYLNLSAPKHLYSCCSHSRHMLHEAG